MGETTVSHAELARIIKRVDDVAQILDDHVDFDEELNASNRRVTGVIKQIEDSHVDSIVYARGEVAYLGDKVGVIDSKAELSRQLLAKTTEDTRASYEMCLFLKDELLRYEAKLDESNRHIASLEKYTEKLEEEIRHARALTLQDDELRSLRNDITALQVHRNGVDCALSDDLTLNDMHGGDILVSAAVLNAAAAGTFKRTIRVVLKAAILGTHMHNWAQFTPPAPLPSKGDVADVDISAPTIEETPPLFVDGVMDVTLVFDTDAGATKTYVSGEVMSLGSIKVAADDLLPTGQTVAEHSVTITVVD